MATKTYDPEKDVLIEKIGKVTSSESTRKSFITIGLYSYNGGPAKVGINRVFENTTGRINIGKLGRFTIDEAYRISQCLLNYIKENRDSGKFSIPVPVKKVEI